MLATIPSASAGEATQDLGVGRVRYGWADVPNCVVELPDLPCLVGWDDNGTPSDLGDDTFYNYYAVEYLDVDVDPIGPIEGTSFHYDPEEQYVGHHLLDLLDSVLMPLEQALPPPVGDWTDYRQAPRASTLQVCPPVSSVGPVEDTCVQVPFFIPNSDRNGTHLPPGVNHPGDSTDAFMDGWFDLLRLCRVRHLGHEASPTCDLLPIETLRDLWHRTTPNLVNGVAVNETDVNAMDPQADSATSDPQPGDPGPVSDAAQPVPTTFPGVGPEGRPLPPWERGPMPASRPAEWSDDRHKPPASTREHGDHARALPEGSWLLPVAAAAAAAAPLAWALYHRITRERALRHATRRRLLELILAHPGLSVGDAAKRLGLTYHTTAHHVRVLRRTGRIEVLHAGRHVMLHPVGVVPRDHREAVGHLRRGPQAEVLRALDDSAQGLGVSELATRLGCAKSSAHAKLRRLADHGLVEKIPGGRYLPTRAGEEALRSVDSTAAADAATAAAATTGAPAGPSGKRAGA